MGSPSEWDAVGGEGGGGGWSRDVCAHARWYMHGWRAWPCSITCQEFTREARCTITPPRPNMLGRGCRCCKPSWRPFPIRLRTRMKTQTCHAMQAGNWGGVVHECLKPRGHRASRGGVPPCTWQLCAGDGECEAVRCCAADDRGPCDPPRRLYQPRVSSHPRGHVSGRHRGRPHQQVLRRAQVRADPGVHCSRQGLGGGMSGVWCLHAERDPGPESGAQHLHSAVSPRATLPWQSA